MISVVKSHLRKTRRGKTRVKRHVRKSHLTEKEFYILLNQEKNLQKKIVSVQGHLNKSFGVASSMLDTAEELTRTNMHKFNEMLLKTPKKLRKSHLKVEDISKEDFYEYERVRESGVTNMFDTKVVSELSGLNREKIIAIMKNYGNLMKKYPSVRKSHLYIPTKDFKLERTLVGRKTLMEDFTKVANYISRFMPYNKYRVLVIGRRYHIYKGKKKREKNEGKLVFGRLMDAHVFRRGEK